MEHYNDPDPNGSVDVDETTLGNTANYSCNLGYILVGSATVKCLYTGLWSDFAPACECKQVTSRLPVMHLA